MAVFVVTWNLNKERTNYSSARNEFIKHLERYDNIGDPGLESVRFISTGSTAAQISTYLRQKLDNNDNIFVSKINRYEKQGWLKKNVWDWINIRI